MLSTFCWAHQFGRKLAINTKLQMIASLTSGMCYDVIDASIISSVNQSIIFIPARYIFNGHRMPFGLFFIRSISLGGVMQRLESCHSLPCYWNSSAVKLHQGTIELSHLRRFRCLPDRRSRRVPWTVYRGGGGCLQQTACRWSSCLARSLVGRASRFRRACDRASRRRADFDAVFPPGDSTNSLPPRCYSVPGSPDSPPPLGTGATIGL